METSCGCKKNEHLDTNVMGGRRVAGGRTSMSLEGSGTIFAKGTVLDGTKGIAGYVSAVSNNGEGEITVVGYMTGGECVTATLRPGVDNLFENITVNSFVFCAVVLQRVMPVDTVRGVCFWIQTFPAATSSRPEGKRTAPPSTTSFTNEKLPKTFSRVLISQWVAFQTSSPPNESRHTNEQIGALADRAGLSVDASLRSLEPTCVIAAMKAMCTIEFCEKAFELFGLGYYPLGFECHPGYPNTEYTGYIQVAFRFRQKDLGDERVIVVPVDLGTWIAAGRNCDTKTTIGQIQEVPTDFFPSTRSLAIYRTCADVTVRDGQVCLNVPLYGSTCVSVPDVFNGQLAEVCFDICKNHGIPCGVQITVYVGNQEVGSASLGCC